MNDLRYPIGRFVRPKKVHAGDLEQWITELAELPEHLRRATAQLSDEQLDVPYRPGGWTVRQVVHHVPDSHLNSYQRFRLALTEEEPVIKPYDEAAWANLADAKTAPIEPSLQFATALHARWVLLLRSLSDEQWLRQFNHPENGMMRLDTTAALYAWHSRHHVAHILALREREKW